MPLDSRTFCITSPTICPWPCKPASISSSELSGEISGDASSLISVAFVCIGSVSMSRKVMTPFTWSGRGELFTAIRISQSLLAYFSYLGSTTMPIGQSTGMKSTTTRPGLGVSLSHDVLPAASIENLCRSPAERAPAAVFQTFLLSSVVLSREIAACSGPAAICSFGIESFANYSRVMRRHS